jgi:dipeptidyl aminopeptidase/acylaminoacyl peptidase
VPGGFFVLFLHLISVSYGSIKRGRGCYSMLRAFDTYLAGLFLWLSLTPQTALAAPALSAYGALPGFEQAAISPSGRYVALIATVGETRVLAMLENGKVVRKVALDDTKVRNIQWADDATILLDLSYTQRLYGYTADKAEKFRTLVISTDENKPVSLVFEKQKNIEDETYGRFGLRAINGRTYGFFGGLFVKNAASNSAAYLYGNKDYLIWKVDLATMAAEPFVEETGDGEWYDYLIDENGELGARLIFIGGSGNWRIKNKQGQEIAKGTNKNGGISLTAFGKDGTSIIYTREDEETQEQSYFEVPLSGGAPVELLSDIDVDHLYTDRRNGRMIGYQLSGKDGAITFFDPVLTKKFAKIARAFPNLNRSLVDWTADMSKVLVATNGNKDSGTWWTVDLAANSANPVGIERPTVSPDDVGPISTISYEAKDGLAIEGILTLPPHKEAKNLPVIMLPHGGPTAHDSATFDWWAQGLASRGYAVFQPNFRGSTNKDASFMKAGHGEWGRKMQTDISDGLAHLAAQGIVDPKRACIVGASYGGYAALAGVTLQQGLYRCAAAVAGVSDLSLMVSTDIQESGDNPVLKRNLNAEIGKGRELKDVSPRRFAAQADAPILLVHGKDDVVVPYKQSIMMADALKGAGKPYEMVPLEGEDHWLSKSMTRQKMLEVVVAFVEKHNPPN